MDPSAGRRSPFSQGIKPAHLAVFLLAYFIRRSYSASTTGDDHAHGDGGSGGHAAGDGHGAHAAHGEHGYQVFHVEFERVQLPFIISLWIFVSSLAKIGESRERKKYSQFWTKYRINFLEFLSWMSQNYTYCTNRKWAKYCVTRLGQSFQVMGKN